MLAICGNESLREFASPGKSGSAFYLTQDERYMIKTMKKSEIKVNYILFCVHIAFDNICILRFFKPCLGIA